MKKIIKMFIAILAVVCVFGLVSCKDPGKDNPKEEVKPYNALGGFTVGDETNVYSIATNTTEKLDFDYTKLEDEAHRNAYLKMTIDSTVKLEEYKKLVIAISGLGDVKIELVAGTETKSVSLNAISTPYEVEWNLIPEKDILSKVTEIRIYGAAGRVSTTGQVEISCLKFDVAVADNTIIQTDYTNIPSNVNEYNGTDENFDFNAKWNNLDPEKPIYEIEQDPTTKVVDVMYHKEAGDEWACMISNVRGKLDKFKYVVVVAEGAADKKLLIKVEGTEITAKETTETFDGTKQTFVLDISTYEAADKNAISRVVLFGAPGAIQDGSFKIHEAYMSETSPIAMEEIHVNEYDGTSEEFDISDYWYDGSDKVYTTEKVADGVKVTFTEKGEWATLKAYVRGKLSNFKYLAIEVSSAVGSSVMLKAANGCESSITTLTSERQVVYVNIQSVENLDSLSEVIVFGNPGSKDAGEFTIHKAYFANEIKGVEMPTTNTYDKYYETFDINHYWADNNTGTYTVTEEGTKTIVNYTKAAGNEWATVKTTLEGVTDEFTALKLVIKGTGTQILVKPNDDGAYEKYVNLTGEEQTVYVRIPHNMTVVHIFCEPGTAGDTTGTLEIIEAKLVRDVVVTDEETNVELVNSIFTSEPNIYEITSAEKGITINYNKTAGNWSTIKTFVAGANEEFKTLTLTFKGVAGTQILVKPNDNGQLEQWIDVTGEEQVITIKDLPSPFVSLIMFIAPNTTEPVTGVFELKSAVLSKTEAPVETTPIEGTYSDGTGDKHFYNITTTEDVTTVEYNVSEAGYYWFALNLTTPVERVNKLYMTFTSTADVKILVKPNDNGALEKEIVVTPNGVVFEQTISGTLTKVIIFVSPLVASGEGTLTITNVGVTIVEGPVTNEYTGGATFDVNKNWHDAGDKVYTVNVAGTDTEIDFTKGALEWPSVKTLISGVTNEFNYIAITVSGTEGLVLKIKAVGDTQIETDITISETAKTFYATAVEGLKEILIFAAPGTANATGSFVIKSATLMHLETAEGNLAGKLVSSNGKFTATPEGVITFTEKGTWDSAYVKLLPQATEGKAIEVSVTSETVTEILVKLNNDNAYQTTINLENGAGSAKITNLPAELTEVRVFADFKSGNASGTFTADIQVVEETTPVALTWEAVDGGDGVFTITPSTTGALFDVAFAKTDSLYAHMKLNPSKSVKGTKVTVVMSATENTTVTLKPNDSHETPCAVTATPTPFIIEMGEEVAITRIIVMVEITIPTISGAFTIHEITVE